MRFNFKKISAIASSVLLTGMTVGVAAAANYPAPFVSGGTADVAIVYGTGAGVSALDQVEATNIQSDLSSGVSGGSSTASGGDAYKFEKATRNFNLGDKITEVVSTDLDDDELGDLLADGVYVDDDNDEFDYTQSVAMGTTLQLTYFEDNDYARDEPTLGFQIADGTTVLTYTLDFTDEPLLGDLETTELTMMGKDYYVLDVTNTSNGDKFTLLDSATDTILNEGESKTILGHDVSLSFIGSTEVKFIVDGQTTNALSEGETQKLSDGSYIGVKEILVQDYQGGQKQVEFSIGSGKLILENGQAVELNDDDVDEITVTITNSSGTDLSSIALAWATDDDEFVTETTDLTMPGFESLKLSFGGLTLPAEEEIYVENSGDDVMVLSDFPLKGTVEDIPLFLFNQTDGNIIAIGEDTDEVLVTSNNPYVEFDADTDTWFVVSYNDGDDAESYLMRATSFKDDDSTNTTTIQYRKDGAWVDAKVDAEDGDDFSVGSVELLVNQTNKDDKTVNISTTDTDVNFSMLYSAEGLSVALPVSTVDAGTLNVSAGNQSSSFGLVFDEEDEDGNIGDGEEITVTIGTNANNETEVSSYSIDGTSSGALEVEEDLYNDYAYTALATLVEEDNGPDQDTLKIVYHGGEVTADVYISAPGVSVVSGGGLGNVVVKDSEVSSVSSNNLVVVGGSCINSVAANLLGGALCGPAFTSATSVGSGQFLIESMESPYDSSKVALLVAGYEVADTQAASAYLRTQDVDTTVGKKYVGTSSTSAELVVE